MLCSANSIADISALYCQYKTNAKRKLKQKYEIKKHNSKSDIRLLMAVVLFVQNIVTF